MPSFIVWKEDNLFSRRTFDKMLYYTFVEDKIETMNRKLYLLLLLGAIFVSATAQNEVIGLRVTDLEKNRSDLTEFRTSSGTKDNDFPVYVFGEKQPLLFEDVYMILVRHDVEASNPDIYITIEVINLQDKSTLYEAAKYMRIAGNKEGGPFSIKLNQLNGMEVLRKAW